MTEIQDSQFAGIPCYEIMEKGVAPGAEILLYHGWGSNAERQCFRAQLLAGFGYRVIVPEIAGHGKRGTLNYEDGGAALDFLRVLVQSIGECAQIAQQAFTPNRAHFLVGHSLGGMIALGALSRIRDSLQGVVAMNSTALWDDAADTLSGVFESQAEVAALLSSSTAQSLLSTLDAADPAHWQAQDITTPALLTNGSLDATLPAALNEAFLAKHSLPQVKHIVIAGAGHVVTDSALREVVGFIEAHR